MKLVRLLLGCLLISAAARAKDFPLTAASTVPAAHGQVKVNHDKNGNTKFEIKVESLAAPGSLTPPSSSYVVWLQERGGQPTPQGELKVGKKLNATFEGVTPAKSFDLFITPEKETNPQAPTGPPVLKATIQP